VRDLGRSLWVTEVEVAGWPIGYCFEVFASPSSGRQKLHTTERG
jgi:hypothetical protein